MDTIGELSSIIEIRPSTAAKLSHLAQFHDHQSPGGTRRQYPCRVEEWRGGLGRGLFSPVARAFVRGCPTISTVLRFHSPLIEPDGRYSRIRLSDKAHSPLRTRRAARPSLKAVEPQS